MIDLIESRTPSRGGPSRSSPGTVDTRSMRLSRSDLRVRLNSETKHLPSSYVKLGGSHDTHVQGSRPRPTPRYRRGPRYRACGSAVDHQADQAGQSYRD